MIPLKDDNPSRNIPFINLMLIAVNIAVFIYQFFFMPEGPAYLINTLGVIPRDLLSLTVVHGSTSIPAPLTVFSAMFIHGGWLHLLGNMLYLWIFGDNVEDRLGHRRYLIFYLSAGVAAALVHAILFKNSTVPCVGASGAISGVLAAYLIFYPKARVTTLFFIFIFIRIVRLPAVVLLGLWIALQIASGITDLSGTAGGVAWFAHVGGFASGLLLALILKPKRRKV
ncbi:MAG: rhomboid family intramembrane serine protease [Desulfobacteraceae bacterium]|jgi:membrane associated rhomboid family serine protease